MSNELYVVVGLGITGISCVRHLKEQGYAVAVTDTRLNPPGLTEMIQLYPDVMISLGKLDDAMLAKATTIVISPGLALQEPAIAAQIERGVSVIGDIELFAKIVKAPVIAITGTNAKSTVTTLVGEMAKNAGVKVQVGGNLGTPVLDLLDASAIELFVLELSSFQLETTFSLKPKVATILNVTPDHMDRYDTVADYTAAKQRVYLGCDVAVCNRDDALTYCDKDQVREQLFFTLNEPKQNEFGLLKQGQDNYLAFGDKPLLAVRELPVLGRHYQANALAALALGHGFGLPFEPMLQTLREFKGLQHRCQLVRQRDGVFWYNDSKGTNVGATLAAIEGLGPEIEGQLILIAGGRGKNADFSALLPAIEKYVKTALLIGEAAAELASVIGHRAEVRFAASMQDAVALAATIAKPGDSVLLSPACASLDMFKNFEHRGDVFTEIVQAL